MPIYEGKEPYLFISYSHKDADTLAEIERFLDESHVRYWYDNGLHSGDDWNAVIAERLRYANACLLLLSPESATSKYVKKELTFAINFEIPVHTLQIKTYIEADIKELPLDIVMTLGTLQMLKMRGNYREKLLHGLPPKVIAAQSETLSEGLEFSLNEDSKSYSLSGLGTCTDDKIVIPSTYNGKPVTRIDDYAFCNRSKSSGFYELFVEGFGISACCSASSIILPNSITSIGKCSFSLCHSLEHIVIPDSVISIGDLAFCHCVRLASITIGNGATGIGDHAFYGCESLTNITIGNSVTSIGDSAFNGCESLTSITLPNSVTTIGERAFEECYNLANITIGDRVANIADGAFAGTAYCANDDNWKDGVLYIGNCLICARSGIRGNYPVKMGTKCISNQAFDKCSNLTGVEIPRSVTQICDFAFDSCSALTNIQIPDSVIFIGLNPFSGCSNLTNIAVSKGNTVYHSAGNCLVETAAKSLLAGCRTSEIPTDGSIATIGDYAFQNCVGFKSITIPDNISSIGEGAFDGCKELTRIEIPDSVTGIEYMAFNGCSNLTSITFKGTIKQWNAIDKGDDWDFGTGKYIIHCSDGEISK